MILSKIKKISVFLILIFSISSLFLFPQGRSYLWNDHYSAEQSMAVRIEAPEGFSRVETEEDTFADWLRHLPLKEGNPPVYLYNGEEMTNQGAHFAVVDIDTGRKNLQQCADAVIRLRAEYLYSINDFDSIHFNFTSGDTAFFTQWAEGIRPRITGDSVEWIQTGRRDDSYGSLRKYLDSVFTYAGSASLSAELAAVDDLRDIRIGDVFIKGGYPGHAVIVVDMAVDNAGKKIFLLAQSYMPAQDIHILKNLNDSALSPWFEAGAGDRLKTPEWIFDWSALKRFKQN